MTAVVRVVLGLLIASIIGSACASDERPEVVPGSTIATSTTASSTTTDRPPTSFDGGSDTDEPTPTLPTTSHQFLDPDDPSYPTTVPPPPRPSVSYPTSG